eukprot:365322-Chlamydomonas_euryale.AAC.11
MRRQGARSAQMRRQGARGAQMSRPGARGAQMRRQGARGAQMRRQGARGAQMRRQSRASWVHAPTQCFVLKQKCMLGQAFVRPARPGDLSSNSPGFEGCLAQVYPAGGRSERGGYAHVKQSHRGMIV